MSKCNHCNEVLPPHKQRFCSEICRSYWYRNQSARKTVIHFIDNNQLSKIPYKIARLQELGFIVTVSTKVIEKV